MSEGYAYNGRLNELKWKGCEGLWAHGGQRLEREVPAGFRTLGVPGILVSNFKVHSQPGLKMPSAEELDDLVRGHVDEQGERDEYDPLYILDHYVTADQLDFWRIALQGESMWMINHKSFGWVAFQRLGDGITWVENTH